MRAPTNKLQKLLQLFPKSLSHLKLWLIPFIDIHLNTWRPNDQTVPLWNTSKSKSKYRYVGKIVWDITPTFSTQARSIRRIFVYIFFFHCLQFFRNDSTIFSATQRCNVEQCCKHSKQYRSNVATLCCAKNRRCNSSRSNKKSKQWGSMTNHTKRPVRVEIN